MPRSTRYCKRRCIRYTGGWAAGSTSSDRSVGASPRSGSLSGQSPQNSEPPALRSARSVLMRVSFQISAMLAVFASPSTRLPYGIGTAADDPAVAEHDERAPRPRAREAGREIIQRQGIRDGGSGISTSISIGQFSHKRLGAVVFVLHGVQEQAFGQYARRSSSVICSISSWIS